MTLRGTCNGCLSLLFLGSSLCVQAQTKAPAASDPACSGRFPPVTCVANGRTLKQDITTPPAVPAAAAKQVPNANASAPAPTTAEPPKGYAAEAEDEPLPLSKDELFGTSKPG